ncbi:hypothetical protein C8R44DRAFT_872504 [Mycena epipterygia]|nr:hypothetical protein C8R44DRAFT_872504 [Mycena epipterygia]
MNDEDMANYSASTLRNVVAETTVEIAHYESLLDKLRTKRQSALLQLDSIMYPVVTLPPEITSAIFLYCLPTAYTDREWNSVNPHEAPVLLSHVCRTWRDVAFSTSALWAQIELKINDEESVDVFKTWLTRAGGFPLSVKLYMEWNLEEDDRSVIVKETFADRSRGMQSLELSAGVEDIQIMATADANWSFPLLHKLVICILDEDYSFGEESQGTAVSAIEMFTNAPLLREASLFKAPPSFITLPWHQLTKFTGNAYAVTDCLQVLRFIPNLTECTFAAFQEDHDPDAAEILTHSKLESLVLFGLTSDESDPIACSGDILNFLRLPALQTLRIFDFEGDMFYDDILGDFLARSSAPLREFTIREDNCTSLDMTSLVLMPTLVSFEIWRPSSGSSICEFFETFNGQDTSFLPQLEHLSLLDCGSRPSAYTLLELAAEGLSGRRAVRDRGFAELKSFRLTWAGEFGDLVEGALLPFRELVAEGMDISIEGKFSVYI